MPATIVCIILSAVLYSWGTYPLSRIPNLLSGAVLIDTIIIWCKLLGTYCTVNYTDEDNLHTKNLNYIVKWYSRFYNDGYKWLYYANTLLIFSVSLYTASYIAGSMFVLGCVIYVLNIEQWAFRADQLLGNEYG